MGMKIYVSTDDKHIKQIVLDDDDMLVLEWALKGAKVAARLNSVNESLKETKELWKDVMNRIDYIRESVIVKGGVKQVQVSRLEYSLLMLIRRVRLPPRAVAVLIADHFRRHKNYERLEIARIYQDSMESIEREERRNKNERKG